jgi:hypothetical protein
VVLLQTGRDELASRNGPLRDRDRGRPRPVAHQRLPRRTRLELPGWAGKPSPGWTARMNAPGIVPDPPRPGSSRSIHTYPNELRVSTRDGQPQFQGDFGESPDHGLQWPPFRTFGDDTCRILLNPSLIWSTSSPVSSRASRKAASTNACPGPTPPCLPSEPWPENVAYDRLQFYVASSYQIEQARNELASLIGLNDQGPIAIGTRDTRTGVCACE